MTSMRAAAYLGGGALLVAWFAAAGVAPVQEAETARDAAPHGVSTSGSASLAADVQTQALKLRDRLAAAPVPDIHPRNPFSFAPVAPRRAVVPAKDAAIVPPPPEQAVIPPLSLMGIAEETLPDGPHRTAIIGGVDDALYMVSQGQTIANRYRVTAIGQDAVELEDIVTGAYRRLAMR
jgi:hypothetical protein